MRKRRYTDYDSFAWIYNKHWGHFSTRIIPLLEKMVFPDVPQKGKILDLCCGTGHLAHVLTSQGYSITGIDSSKEMIKFARENAPDADFIIKDARNFSLPPNFNAAVSLFDSLNHVMELEDLKVVFQNVFSALCPGGLFLFDLNMEEGFEKRWKKGTFNIVEDDHVCVVRSSYDSDKRVGKFDITIFRFIDQWKRSDISLLQKCYSEEDITLAMKATGFENIQALDAIVDLGLKDVGRTFFLAEKLRKANKALQPTPQSGAAELCRYTKNMHKKIIPIFLIGFFCVAFFPLSAITASHLSPEDAKQIAFENYIKTMDLNVLAEEGPRTPILITIGTDVANFARKGDSIWEVRISTIENELRAIIFVHDQTKKTYLLFSPHLKSINAEPKDHGPAEKEPSIAWHLANSWMAKTKYSLQYEKKATSITPKDNYFIAEFAAIDKNQKPLRLKVDITTRKCELIIE